MNLDGYRSENEVSVGYLKVGSHVNLRQMHTAGNITPAVLDPYGGAAGDRTPDLRIAN